MRGTAARRLTAEEIAASDDADGARGDGPRCMDRFARALATVVNILDPDVIVLGGGLSNIESLYRDLPPLVERYGFNLGGATTHREECAWRFERRARRGLAWPQ